MITQPTTGPELFAFTLLVPTTIKLELLLVLLKEDAVPDFPALLY